MRVVRHQYNGGGDYHRIGQLLVDTYRPGIRHENWLQPRWEYMHYHPWLDESALDRIGMWESGGTLVAVAHCELTPGQAFFQVHPDFRHLKLELLEYAETHLSAESGNGERALSVWVNDFDSELEDLVNARGYRMVEEAKDCWSVLEITNQFPNISLPKGYRLHSLAEENDLNKLNRVLHRGFNHPGEPPIDGVAGRRKMQSAPNYRKDLNIVAVDPNGIYASYCGIWQDHVNRVAYVEPVCTDPDYRRMRLGTAVVLEAIRRCGAESATVAMVGSDQPLYMAMGFKKLFGIRLWTNRQAQVA